MLLPFFQPSSYDIYTEFGTYYSSRLFFDGKKEGNRMKSDIYEFYNQYKKY